MKRFLPYLAALLAMFLWASSFIVIKMAFEYMGPITITFLRMLIASLIMPLIYYLSPQRDRIILKHLPKFMLLSFFEPFLYFIGESNGMVYVPASYGAVIISLIPLITPFFAWLIIKEKISRWGIAGTVISFLGVILIVMEQDEATATTKGIAYLFLAVFSAVGYGITLGTIARQYRPVTIVMIQTFCGLIFFLPVFLIFEGNRYFSDLPPLAAYYPVAGLAIFCTCGAFLLFTSAIRKIGLNNANIFSNMIPVFTTVLAYFILREAISFSKAFGTAIVVGGLFLSQIPALRRRPV